MIWPVGANLLAQDGDGIKNYFTPAWYLTQDQGTQFTGMHYPFGDNVVYSDNQPIISWFLKIIQRYIYPIGPYSPWVFHLLIMFSFVACAMLVYEILSRWIPNRWVSITAAILITFLSPQTERMYAHFALAYTVYVPLIWYQLIRLEETAYNWKKILLLGISLTVFTFIHLYYLLIGVMFILALLLVQLIKKEINLKVGGQILLAVMLPFVVFFSYTLLTDSINDRPTTPYGFFEYRASFQSIFIPLEGRFHDWWFLDMSFTRASLEGYAWVGYSGILILIISIILLFRRFSKKVRLQERIVPDSFRSFLVASLLVLAFSMALPFSLGLDGLLDVIPFIKQFRSPGRFAWVFYFVFTVYGIILIHQLSRKVKHKVAGSLITLGFLILFMSDTYTYVDKTSSNLQTAVSDNIFLHETPGFTRLFPNKELLQSEFQAILYLPYFHNGSEKLYLDRTFGAFGSAMRFSYHSGLPMMNCMMSRTSISQSMLISSLLGHSLIPKTIPQGMSERPLLLIIKDGYLIPTEQFIQSRGTWLGSADGHQFYSLPMSAFEHTQSELMHDFKSKKNSLYQLQPGEYFAEQPLFFFYRNSFEQETGEPYLGKGAIYRESGREYLVDVPVDISETVWAEVSCWTYTFFDQNAYPSIRIELIGGQGEVIQKLGTTAKESTDIDGNWVRASIAFPTPPSCKSIRLTLLADSRALIDELVVRDTRYHIFYDVAPNNESLIFNNFPIGK